MHRIDGAGHVGNMFVTEDPAINRPPTEVTAEFMNALQQELAQVIEVSGITLSKPDNTQLTKALQTGKLFTAAGGGTADAITASFAFPITSLALGLTPLLVRAASANATPTPTFTPNIGVIAEKTIVKGGNLPLAPGDISGAGHWLQLLFDGALDKWVLLNPATGFSLQSLTDVSGSRAINTVYTNTKGRPITIYVYGVTIAPAGYVALELLGAQVVVTSQPTNASGVGFCAIIPANESYKVTITDVTLNRWFELS